MVQKINIILSYSQFTRRAAILLDTAGQQDVVKSFFYGRPLKLCLHWKHSKINTCRNVKYYYSVRSQIWKRSEETAIF